MMPRGRSCWRPSRRPPRSPCTFGTGATTRTTSRSASPVPVSSRAIRDRRWRHGHGRRLRRDGAVVPWLSLAAALLPGRPPTERVYWPSNVGAADVVAVFQQPSSPIATTGRSALRSVVSRRVARTTGDEKRVCYYGFTGFNTVAKKRE